jgi:hypothetical protein
MTGWYASSQRYGSPRSLPAAPLNYFIYPHAEANGAEIGTASVQLEFKDM